jgi:hypothetical protein
MHGLFAAHSRIGMRLASKGVTATQKEARMPTTQTSMDRLEERTSPEGEARPPQELSDQDAAERAEEMRADDDPTRRAEQGQSYLPAQASTEANEAWQRIQAAFVDDPRKSVAEAHQLVGELMKRIAEGFARDRDQLERQWSTGGSASTEDLRLCLQRYRAFFGRLLRDV